MRSLLAAASSLQHGLPPPFCGRPQEPRNPESISFLLRPGLGCAKVWSCLAARYQCPDHENAAEFLADLISTDYSSAESVQSSLKRIENLIDEFANKVLMTEFNSPVTQLEGSEFSTKVAQKSI